MKIYTRTGDKGQTGLFGGKRIAKSSARLHAYGSIDELNALIGLILTNATLPTSVRDHLEQIQLSLFIVGADLATPQESKTNVKRIDLSHATTLENWIDTLEMSLEPLQAFIFPSGSAAGCQLQLARTVCRRAERWVVELQEKETINPELVVYLNRLSDYLFVAARFTNRRLDAAEREVRIPRE